MQSYKLCFHFTLCVVLVKIQYFSMFICDVTAELMNINEIGSIFWKPFVKIAAVFTIHLLATNAVKILLSMTFNVICDKRVQIFHTIAQESSV